MSNKSIIHCNIKRVFIFKKLKQTDSILMQLYTVRIKICIPDLKFDLIDLKSITRALRCLARLPSKTDKNV